MTTVKSPKAAKPPSYTQALADAISELTSLMNERETLKERIEAIDGRINRLRRAAISVNMLCDTRTSLASEHPELFPEHIDSDVGLTDAIRQTLKSTNYYFSAVEIRDDMKSREYDLSKYKNVLASIHTVLKRLKNQQEVVEGSRGGRTTYRWKNVDEIAGDDIPF